MHRTLIPAFVAVALAISTSSAQETVKQGAVNDKLFAAAAAEAGMVELALSQVGAERATSEELKKFSKQMIEDHTRLNQELGSLASQKAITLPRAVEARGQFCVQSLDGVSGKHFDRCYAKAQLMAHMEAVGTFEAEADRGHDADLKAFAAKALPTLKKHLAMIKPIAAKFEESSSDSGKK